MSEKKNGNSKIQLIIAVLVLVVSATSLLYFFATGSFSKKDGTQLTSDITGVKICFADTHIKKYQTSIELGAKSEELECVSGVGELKSIEFDSLNPEIFTVTGTAESKCKITGVKEGTGVLQLAAVDENGKKYKETMLVSVYRKANKGIELKVNVDTDVYRGALNNGLSGQDEVKGSLKKGTTVKLLAKCKDYYLVKTTDGSTFSDKKDNGYIPKKFTK